MEELKESLHGSIIGDVPGYSGDSGERFDGTKVDTDDESFLPYTLLGDLKPSAGRRTKIHDPVTLIEDVETIVDLHDLERCPGAIVHPLSELVIVLVMSFVQPALVHVSHLCPF